MYYLKNPNSMKYVMNFEHVWNKLDFRDFITYPANRKALKAWMKQHSSGAADLAAAVFTLLNKLKGNDELLKEALGYCEKMIQDEGYEPADVSKISALEGNHVVLVPGCQGPLTFENRARAAYTVLSIAPHTNFTVVFSGKDPSSSNPEAKLQTKNEAVAMRECFQAFVRKAGRSFQTKHVIQLENKSANTEQNIAHFFSGNYIRRDIPAVLYLVTSTFHVPRLVRVAEKHITDDSSLQDKVRDIVAVGAEDRVSKVVKSDGYIKWMMFEVFQHLLTNSKPRRWPDEDAELSPSAKHGLSQAPKSGKGQLLPGI